MRKQMKEAVRVDQELCRYCDTHVEITRDVHGMPEQLDGLGQISCGDCYEHARRLASWQPPYEASLLQEADVDGDAVR